MMRYLDVWMQAVLGWVALILPFLLPFVIYYIYSKYKKRDMKSWLKSGLMGAGIGLCFALISYIIYFFIVMIMIATSPSGAHGAGLGLILAVPLIPVIGILGFIIGVIIGSISKKLDSENVFKVGLIVGLKFILFVYVPIFIYGLFTTNYNHYPTYVETLFMFSMIWIILSIFISIIIALIVKKIRNYQKNKKH